MFTTIQFSTDRKRIYKPPSNPLPKLHERGEVTRYGFDMSSETFRINESW